MRAQSKETKVLANVANVANEVIFEKSMPAQDCWR